MSSRTSVTTESLERHRQDWETLAGVDPLWAILSERGKRYGRWDEQEFFATGTRQVDHHLDRAASLGHSYERERVLDFGCGVGRLAPALSGSFATYSGVDISDQMVALARRFHRSRPNCSFSMSADPTLAPFADRSFDLVITLYVLQHILSRATIATYLGSLVRVLASNGLLIFQLPEYIPSAEKRLYDTRRAVHGQLRRLGLTEAVLYRRLGLFAAAMNFVAEDEVVAVLGAHGARVIDVEHGRAGLAIRDRTYYVVRYGSRLRSGQRIETKVATSSASPGPTRPASGARQLHGSTSSRRHADRLATPSDALEEHLARLGTGKRALDLGCGTGSWLPRMRQVGLRPVGLEHDPDRARQAVAQGPVVVADAPHLPFADASIGLVGCIQVLHHLADPAVVLAAVHRVLGAGGHLVLAESVEDSPIMRLARRLRPEWEGVPVRSRFSTAQLRIMLESAGFEVVVWRHHSPISFLALVLPVTRGRVWQVLTRLERRAPAWLQRRGAHLECVARRA